MCDACKAMNEQFKSGQMAHVIPAGKDLKEAQMVFALAASEPMMMVLYADSMGWEPEETYTFIIESFTIWRELMRDLLPDSDERTEKIQGLDAIIKEYEKDREGSRAAKKELAEVVVPDAALN